MKAKTVQLLLSFLRLIGRIGSFVLRNGGQTRRTVNEAGWELAPFSFKDLKKALDEVSTGNVTPEEVVQNWKSKTEANKGSYEDYPYNY